MFEFSLPLDNVSLGPEKKIVSHQVAGLEFGGHPQGSTKLIPIVHQSKLILSPLSDCQHKPTKDKIL